MNWGRYGYESSWCRQRTGDIAGGGEKGSVKGDATLDANGDDKGAGKGGDKGVAASGLKSKVSFKVYLSPGPQPIPHLNALSKCPPTRICQPRLRATKVWWNGNVVREDLCHMF
jgi:hypothetical protein